MSEETSGISITTYTQLYGYIADALYAWVLANSPTFNEVGNNPKEEDLEKIKQELEKAGLPVIKLDANWLQRKQKAYASETKETVPSEEEILFLGKDSFSPNTNTTVRFQLAINGDITSEDILNVLQGIIEKNGFNFSGADLRNTDLDWAILSGANLSGADFSNALILKADLSNANLSNTVLFETDFYNTNLSDANFTRANLIRAYLTKADLSRTNLSGANLFGANLIDTKFFSDEELEQTAEELSSRFIDTEGLTEEQIARLKPKQAAKLRDVLEYNKIEIISSPSNVIGSQERQQ